MLTFSQTVVDKLTSQQVRKFVTQLEPTFKTLPHLPKGLVDFMVSVAPWLVGLGGILGVFSGLGMIATALGIGRTWWMSTGSVAVAHLFVLGILQLFGAGILLLAFSRLREKQYTGWLLLFCNLGLSIAQQAINILFSFGAIYMGSLLWTAFGVMLGLYVLFEMKNKYLD